MVIAGSILIILSIVYMVFMINRFKITGFLALSKFQKVDLFGNILIIMFFSFLGAMFIINNL